MFSCSRFWTTVAGDPTCIPTAQSTCSNFTIDYYVPATRSTALAVHCNSQAANVTVYAKKLGLCKAVATQLCILRVTKISLVCRTYSFLALMVLLRCPPDQLQQQGQEVLTKFSDLVVKCLIKLTKALQSTLNVSFYSFCALPCLCIWPTAA